MSRGLIWLLLAAVAPVGFAADQDSQRSALEAFFSNLGAAAQSGDREAYMSYFAPEAAMFLPHRPPLIGRTEIGNWAASFFAKLELHLDSYEQQEIQIVGDVAMVRSHASGHYLNKGSAKRYALDQKYLDVARYSDGNWQLEYHVANSNTFDDGVWESDWESQ
jgi:uncharacterized protein (TIGR02246 family)